MATDAYDLMYCDDRAEYDKWQRRIKQAWPTVVVADASDFIHRDRFEVTLPGVAREVWLRWVMEEGMASGSLEFGFALELDKPLVKRLLDEIKAGPELARGGAS